MKLNEFLSVSNSQVCGGSDYLWNCYPNARYMDIADIDGAEIGSCVFNTNTQEVYEAEAYVYNDDIAFRWQNAAYTNAYFEESNKRELDPDNAYDDVQFTDIDDEQDFLAVLFKIVHKSYVHTHYHDVETTDTCCGSCTGKCDNSKKDSNEADAIPVVLKDVTNYTKYEVKLSVTHRFSILACNMEEALIKARTFTNSMSPAKDWGSRVCWEDKYISKEEVARTLAYDHIEE
jgi:hypothetical protein